MRDGHTWPGESAKHGAHYQLTIRADRVELIAEPGVDKDRHGRHLRHVHVDREDFGVEMVKHDHTRVYQGKNNASDDYVQTLYAHDVDYASNPPAGMDCSDPVPSSGPRIPQSRPWVRVAVNEPDEVDRFVAAYAKPGRTHAGFEHFRQQDAGETAVDAMFTQHGKLTIPVLGVGWQHSMEPLIGAELPKVATNVTSAVVPNANHWVLEENPSYVLNLLTTFPGG